MVSQVLKKVIATERSDRGDLLHRAVEMATPLAGLAMTKGVRRWPHARRAPLSRWERGRE